MGALRASQKSGRYIYLLRKAEKYKSVSVLSYLCEWRCGYLATVKAPCYAGQNAPPSQPFKRSSLNPQKAGQILHTRSLGALQAPTLSFRPRNLNQYYICFKKKKKHQNVEYLMKIVIKGLIQSTQHFFETLNNYCPNIDY